MEVHSRHMRSIGTLLACSLFALICLLTAPGRADAAQDPSPLVVDADTVSYDQVTQLVTAIGNVRLSYKGIRLSADSVVFDLREELLTAQGRVVLVDPEGRELRGETLTYDVRTSQGVFTNTETVVSNVYIRSAQLQTFGQRIVATDAMFTTCDPARPAYRVTARRIEVIPGDRIIATGASLWIGSFRVFTLPVYTISLRSAEETARSFPSFGYNHVDGLWADYGYRYSLGSISGRLYGKYGTGSGFIVNNTLAYRRPSYAIALVTGRNQNADLLIFDQAELSFALTPQRLGSLPLFADVAVGGGWFREIASGLGTSRLQYRIGLSTPVIPLGPKTTWQTTTSWQDAFYGTGHHYGVVRAGSSLVHILDARSTLGLNYRAVQVLGTTPFLFDAVDPDDIVHELNLQYTLTGSRGAELFTRFTTGSTYYFMDRSVSLNVGYGERVPNRYQWGFGLEYNLHGRFWKISTDTGLSVGRGTYVTVQAIYNTGTRLFEDLDYTVISRICDCFDVSLRYRQVRREIWIQIGLAPFPGIGQE